MKFHMGSLIPLMFENRFVPFPTWAWTVFFHLNRWTTNEHAQKYTKLPNSSILPNMDRQVDEIEKLQNWDKSSKISRWLDFRFKVPFKWYRVFPHLALTHLALFCKIEESSTMHWIAFWLEIKSKTEFPFVRFLSLFSNYCFKFLRVT